MELLGTTFCATATARSWGLRLARASLVLLTLAATSACAPLEEGDGEDELALDVGDEALTDAEPARNPAVVQIVHSASGRKCTGTVIGSDVVLTSALCLYGQFDLASLPADKVGVGYVPSGLSFSVYFNTETPTEPMTARHVSVFSYAADMALLALPRVAPARMPIHFAPRTTFSGAHMIGYDGAGAQRRTNLTVAHAFTIYEPYQIVGVVPHPSPALLEMRDMGAPVIVDGGLYAVVSGLAHGDNWVVGDSTVGGTPIASSPLRTWLRSATELSACASRAGGDGIGRRALYHWLRGTDHLTTTDAAMSGCYAGDFRRIDESSGYTFVAIEGYAIPPNIATPADAKELRIFRRSTPLEHATSTTDQPPVIGGGYETHARIGSVFATPASDRLELFRFFNRSTRDFLTKLGSEAPLGYQPGISLGFVFRDPFLFVLPIFPRP